MNKSMTVMAAAAMLVSSSAFAQTYSKADCNKYAEVWRTAYNNRDANALANMYDAKAGMLSTPWWTATGHDELLAGFKAEMSAGATITSIVCDHSSMIGATTIAVADGTWTGTGKGPDGKDVSVQGHWMATSETRDGKIVTLAHVSNMQMPQPQAEK